MIGRWLSVLDRVLSKNVPPGIEVLTLVVVGFVGALVVTNEVNLRYGARPLEALFRAQYVRSLHEYVDDSRDLPSHHSWHTHVERELLIAIRSSGGTARQQAGELAHRLGQAELRDRVTATPSLHPSMPELLHEFVLEGLGSPAFQDHAVQAQILMIAANSRFMRARQDSQPTVLQKILGWAHRT